MLKAADAGKLLGISARKMYALAESGEVACHRFGAAVRFDPADLEEYKNRCRSPATTPVARPEPEPIPTGMMRASFLGRVVLVPIPPPEPKPTAYELRKQRNADDARRKEERRALVLFHANKRRAARLHRTPPWSDLDAMRAVYAEAQMITRETGIQHHVDHVIPLQGALVSGLHVPGNLQIITGTENSRKRNRYEA